MPFGIRPTQNITRKAIFDILGQDLNGLVFADIFSGSGAIGLEAISRGAKEVYFVENNPKCRKVIDENISLLGINDDDDSGYSEVLEMDGFFSIKELYRRDIKFDIVFIDPPYGRKLAKKALKTIGAYDILQPNCLLAIQCEKELILPENYGRFNLLKTKITGSTGVYIYK